MDAGHPDVGEPLDAILECPGTDRGLLGDRKVAGPGSTDQDGASAGRRRLGLRR